MRVTGGGDRFPNSEVICNGERGTFSRIGASSSERSFRNTTQIRGGSSRLLRFFSTYGVAFRNSRLDLGGLALGGTDGGLMAAGGRSQSRRWRRRCRFASWIETIQEAANGPISCRHAKRKGGNNGKQEHRGVKEGRHTNRCYAGALHAPRVSFLRYAPGIVRSAELSNVMSPL